MSRHAPEPARCIRLRRPATLSFVDEPYVPEGPRDQLDEIEARWRRLCEDNPAWYDGRLCHVLGVHRNGHGGAVLHVADCAYRFFAVQDASFDLGVRPLGVKGITMRDGLVLLGRRARHVGGYPEQWEFAPSGTVEPGREPAEALVAELEEETGLTASRAPTPTALLFDPVARCWEIVFRVEPRAATHDRTPPTAEYDRLEWRRRDELPAPLTPVARQMVVLVPRNE